MTAAGPGRDLTIIFPIASVRDEENFRPFDTVAGETIAHRALRSFTPVADRIARVMFICTADDDARFAVHETLRALAPELPIDVVTVAARTSGPAATVALGCIAGAAAGRAIICDIDHRLGITPLLAAADRACGPAAHVATWPLKGEDLKRWSVACVDRAGRVVDVARRQLPGGSGAFVGLIGCYHIPDIAALAARCLDAPHADFAGYFTAAARRGEAAIAVPIHDAEFFGDADRIRAIEHPGLRYRGTIFSDIDGTLFEHEDVPSYATLPRLLPGSAETLGRWSDEGYFVVLCTARDASDEAALTAAIDALGIRYDRLICGLPSGPRVLINDRKPSAIFTTQAQSFEIARNQGIAGVQLPSIDHPTVLRRFEGGSFAETLLLEQDGRQFVRKRARKHEHLAAGYARLRAQYRTLERFGQVCPGIAPMVIGEADNSHEYYYDMEYLDGHRQLNLVDAAEIGPALGHLFETFDRAIYGHRNSTPGIGEAWFERHIEDKIYGKMDALALNATLRPLLIGPGVTMDGIVVPSLETLMFEAGQPAVRAVLAPTFLAAAHGDLTFQNIMVGSTPDSVRVIDMESSGALEAIELDLGKIFQSVFSQYDEWHLRRDALVERTTDGALSLRFVPRAPDAALLAQIVTSWSGLLLCSPDMVMVRGSFYLGLHLIRMVPFRLKDGEDQALYALATGLQWIARSLERARAML